MPMTTTPGILPSLPTCNSRLMGSSLEYFDWRTNTGLVYRWFCMIYTHNWKLDSYSAMVLSGITLKDSDKGNLVSRQNFKLCTWLILLPGKTDDQRYMSASIFEMWLIFCQDGQGLGRTKYDWKIGDKKVS